MGCAALMGEVENVCRTLFAGTWGLRCRRRFSRTKFYSFVVCLTTASGSQNCVAPDV